MRGTDIGRPFFISGKATIIYGIHMKNNKKVGVINCDTHFTTYYSQISMTEI